jgi:limonene-1,2-epoxide hydrolase
MPSETPGPLIVIERMLGAINRHDLEAFVACFAPDYQSEQPLHPDRAFKGREQVRENWATVFAGMPDVHWDLLQTAVDGETVWLEIAANGTRQSDGMRVAMAGVFIAQIRDDAIGAARIYFDEVTLEGDGIARSVRELYLEPESGAHPVASSQR